MAILGRGEEEPVTVAESAPGQQHARSRSYAPLLQRHGKVPAHVPEPHGSTHRLACRLPGAARAGAQLTRARRQGDAVPQRFDLHGKDFAKI